MRKILVAAAALIVMSTPAMAAMSVSFTWGQTTSCFDKNSPPFTVSGVPAGTKTLKFKMTDLDAPDYPHGGGEVAFTGQKSIPYGAFKYTGPCPPTTHTYRFDVRALDGAGKELGKASAKQRFTK